MTTSSDDAWIAIKVTEIIAPFLVGRGPAVQSAILADLLARWVAGHHPLIRERMLADHVRLVEELVPLAEEQQFGPDGHPGRKDMPSE